jgi:hypothetical protein
LAADFELSDVAGQGFEVRGVQLKQFELVAR